MSDIALPDLNTDIGAMTRLFIAETSATHPTMSDTQQAMGWMRRVIANRLARPVPFGSRSSEGICGVIAADRVGVQFAGFDDYPTLSGHVTGNIAAKLAIANNQRHPQQPHYAAFIRAAIDAASNPAPADPCPTGLYFWRTANRGKPVSAAILFRNLAGNAFFTLPADFF